MSDRRTKVAVLGGGPAGVAAAFELSATPELRSRYEVTVYQAGWRLGGKGASGRNAAMCDRIEEHGLHVWFGCYDNAFALIRRCYEERGGAPGSPLATWRDAFKPCGDQIIYERFRDRWVPHEVKLPPTPFEPGDRGAHTPLQVAVAALKAVAGEWRWLAPELGIVAGRALGARFLAASRAADEVRATDPREADLAAAEARAARVRRSLVTAAALLRFVRNRLQRRLVGSRLENDRLRYAFTTFDLLATLVQGIAADELLRRGWGVINGEELTAWLRRHGASALTLETSPYLRAIYDGSFAYAEGDKAKPSMAAGKAAQDYLRGMVSYQGAFMWKMQAGMGDTIFAPLYEVLCARGVKFEFFSAVTALRVDRKRAAIDAVEVVKQVKLSGDRYEPLRPVNGLRCWPSEPDWRQLADGERLAGRAVDLEREMNPLGRKATTLRAGKDFDTVVLAVPPDVQRTICADLLADPRTPAYSEMVGNSHSVMTQAFQLWITRSDPSLGWRYELDSLMSCYVEPLDTYCNMSQLAARECWPAGDRMLDIAYFCGVLGHAGVASQGEADAAATGGFTEYLERDVSDFWPGTDHDDHFDWNVLVDPAERTGPERLKAQYMRANFAASERYVLSLPGTIRYRLWPDESGYENLVLAGDWTRNGIDAGSVESAVTSGMLAAQAICGEPTDIAGLEGWLGADLEDGAASRAHGAAGRFRRRPDPGAPPGDAPEAASGTDEAAR